MSILGKLHEESNSDHESSSGYLRSDDHGRLRPLALKGPLGQVDMTFRLYHLPTLALLIGYSVYWLELLFISPGQPEVSWTASILLCITILHALYGVSWKQGWADWKEWLLRKQANQDWQALATYVACLLPVVVILCSAVLAYSRPPHLAQEYDAVNYHFSLPRQHLLWSTFAHLPWSTADLFPLPLQFAMASYALVTSAPNKMAFLLPAIGLVFLCYRLATSEAGRLSGLLVVGLLVGSHGVATQFGMAMFDLTIAYLAVAALDSWRCRRPVWVGIEVAFLCSAKSWFLILVLGAIAATVLCVKAAERRGWDFGLVRRSRLPNLSHREVRIAVISAGIGLLLIGGPFFAKATYYAGTPLYPLESCTFSGSLCEGDNPSVNESASALLLIRDAYGDGRGIFSFIRHLWTLSVPAEGVMNAFDYPLGLPYLLSFPVFIVSFIGGLRKRKLNVAGVLGVILYGAWWFGSQQTRFLYPAITMIFLIVSTTPVFYSSRNVRGAVILSLILTSVSVFRGVDTVADFGRNRQELVPWYARPASEQGEWRSGVWVTEHKELAFLRVRAFVVQKTGNERATHFLLPVAPRVQTTWLGEDL